MQVPHSLHPDDQILKAYGLGKLGEEQAQKVDSHLEACDDCRAKLSGITSDSFLGRFREGQKPTARSAPDGWLENGTISFAQAQDRSSPPPADTLPPGLVNHPDYEIKRELGRGGMGVVYLAHNAMMGRDEVLKVMGRHIMERPGVLERFQREIRAVAKLRHPNIVAAYHAFRIDGGLVFSMEYVEGLDLARLVKTKGPLSVAHAAYFAYHAAQGLQHAHEKGLIHRDIKPHNLMLTHDGKARLVKVLDFGLAKANREERVDHGLTSEGQALGTPDYIAPEQIVNALDVDIRADLYSLGGTLFYLLTGRPPFQATSLYDIYQAHMSRDAEPLNLIRPEVPAELAALVSKLMAKEPGRRFASPAEVAEALKPFFKAKLVKASSVTSQVRTAQPRRSAVVEKPAAAEPTAHAAISPSRPRRSAGTAATPWESLIDYAEPRPLASVARAKYPRRIWPMIWVATLVGLVALALLAGVLRVNTPDGVIVVENLPKEADVLIDGAKIRFTWPGEDKPLEILAVPGEHQLRVEKDGYKTFGKSVTIKKEGRSEVTVHLDPKPKVPAALPVPGAVKPLRGQYVSLFNGKDLEGWTDLLPNNSEWKVVEGGLLEGRGNGLGNPAVLVSQREDLANFRLRARFRYARGDFGWIEIRRGPKQVDSSAYLIAGGQLSDGTCSMGSLSCSTNYQYGDAFDWKLRTEFPPAEENTWYTLEISAIGNLITTSVDGKKLMEYRDVQERYRQGTIALAANGISTVQYQEVMIQTLPDDDLAVARVPTPIKPVMVKPAPAALSDLDRVATGKWTRIVDANTTLPDPENMKMNDGVLELNHCGLELPEVNGRNLILRARVLKLSGQNVNLHVRVNDSASYGAWFNGPDADGGDLFGIGKRGSPYHGLASSHVGRTFEPDQFVEMALAAIGPTLTLYVDGKKAITVDHDELERGFVRIGSFRGRSLFKDVECQILD